MRRLLSFGAAAVPRGYEQTVEGYGSGFIITSDGVVITNQHVTQGAQQLVVTTRDGRDHPANLLPSEGHVRDLRWDDLDGRPEDESADDLRRALAAPAGGGAVTVWIERNGRLGRTALYVR